MSSGTRRAGGAMDFVALLSGGKDSCYNILQCQRHGHRLRCLANLHPPSTQSELNSFMYQCAGHEVIPAMQECLDVPLVRREIKGQAKVVVLDYERAEEEDEVEDMYELLLDVLRQFPTVKGVSCGAIISTYQRLRVENVCERLGLTVLSYLWELDRPTLIRDIVADGFEVILVKVAGAGLDPYKHLGRSIANLLPALQRLHDKYGLDLCGEGGEYESLVVDGPIFKRRLVITRSRIELDEEDPTVGTMVVEDCHTVEKLSLPPISVQDPLLGALERSVRSILTDSPAAAAAPAAGLVIGATTRRVQLHVNASGLGQSALVLPIAMPFCDPQTAVHDQLREVVSMLSSSLGRVGANLQDVVFVRAFLADLSQFQAFNDAYAQHFPQKHPPSRSCVQAPLPAGVSVALDVTFLADSYARLLSPDATRKVLHVRSLSNWAPQCIGPYAQANVVHDALLFVAGQIALVPGSMQMLAPAQAQAPAEQLLAQLLLSLRNLYAVLRSQGASLRGLASCVVFVRGRGLSADEVQQRLALLRTWLPLAMAHLVKEIEPAASAKRVDAMGDEYEDDGDESDEVTEEAPPSPALMLLVVDELPRGALVEVEALGVKDALLTFNHSWKAETWASTLLAHRQRGDAVFAGDLRDWSLWGAARRASAPPSAGWPVLGQVRFLSGCLAVASVQLLAGEGDELGEALQALMGHLVEVLGTMCGMSLTSWSTLRVCWSASAVQWTLTEVHAACLLSLQRTIGDVALPAVVCLSVDALPNSPDGRPCWLQVQGLAVDLQHIETERWIIQGDRPA